MMLLSLVFRIIAHFSTKCLFTIRGGGDKRRGHPGSNRGPLDLQSNALPLSYIPIR